MTTQKIKKLVEEYYNVDLSDKTRKRHIVHLRFLYYHLAYNHASDGYSLRAIGETLNGFDHATVLYCIKQYKDLYEFDKRFKKMVDPFINEIEQEVEVSAEESTRSLRRQVRRMKDKIIQMEKQLEEIF